MKLCRFKAQGTIRIGMAGDGGESLLDLASAGFTELEPLLENPDARLRLEKMARGDLPRLPLSQVQWCAPVERQEIWAAGVTYLRSKSARRKESDFAALAYETVYTAHRPELFFKALPEKVVPHGQPVGIRRDSRWNVPEPELALVLNSTGQLVGYTVGNDMSSRDIEGENLLYLPQAKIYHRSCALGPWIVLGPTEAQARRWTVRLIVRRQNAAVFSGETSVDKIKRTFDQLTESLFRSQSFPHGAILLTGTGIVPPASFTLQAQDEIEIEVSGIGTLRNSVIIV